MKPIRFALALAAAVIPFTERDRACAASGTAPPPPYSCRLLYDEQKKCAFGSCDKRVIERLTKECLRDGGRP